MAGRATGFFDRSTFFVRGTIQGARDMARETIRSHGWEAVLGSRRGFKGQGRRVGGRGAREATKAASCDDGSRGLGGTRRMCCREAEWAASEGERPGSEARGAFQKLFQRTLARWDLGGREGSR